MFSYVRRPPPAECQGARGTEVAQSSAKTRQAMRELRTASIGRACRRFTAEAGGLATVECAAILTMVAGLSYVAYALLGAPAERALSQATSGTPAAPSGAEFAWLPATALLATLLAAVALVFDRHRRANRLLELQESSLPSALRTKFVEKRQQILRVLTGHTRRNPGECVTVRHLMTTRLTTVGMATTVEEICRL